MFLISDNPGVVSSTTPDFIKISSEYIRVLYSPFQIYFSFFQGYFYISDDIGLIRKYVRTPCDINGFIQLILFNACFYPFSLYQNITPVHSFTEIRNFRNFPEFRKIPEKTDIIGKDTFYTEFEKILNSISCDKNSKYLLYSGGLDSSIIKKYLKDEYISGSTVFDNVTQKEVLEFLDPDEKIIYVRDNIDYFRIFSETEIRFPFINPGFIDDRLHCINAENNNCINIYSGTGADEFLGDYSICRAETIRPNPEWFSENVFFSLYSRIIQYLDRDLIDTVFENTMKWFDLDTLKDRIRFIRDTFLIPNQNNLLRNNVYDFKDMRRKNPFITKDFHDICLSLDNNLLENNVIEKYILKEFAWKKGFMPIGMRVSRDFDYNPDKNYSKEFDEYIRDNINIIPFDILRFSTDICRDMSADTKIKLSIFLKIFSQTLI